MLHLLYPIEFDALMKRVKAKLEVYQNPSEMLMRSVILSVGDNFVDFTGSDLFAALDILQGKKG